MARKQQPIVASSLPLVAIDLGSNGVKAIAAVREGANTLRILGIVESHKHPDYMKLGQIIASETGHAGYMIRETLRLLANQIGIEQLPTAFITVNARSIKIVQVSSKRDQLRKQSVPQKLLDEMEQECRLKIERHNRTVGVLDIIPYIYVLDGVEQDYAPTSDQRATIIEVHYTVFAAQKEINNLVEKSFNQAGISIERAFFRPDALLSAFAAQDGNDVIDSGCAVLDLGAQTTTLTIYKRGTYLEHKVYPQGSYHITSAISAQGITYNLSEQLKSQHGFATPKLVKRNYKLRIPTIDPQEDLLEIHYTDLAELIEYKLQEILGPAFNLLRQYKDTIPLLFITGGGAKLQGIDAYIQDHCSQKVWFGSHSDVIPNNSEEKYHEPQYSALIGTLLAGADYRDNHKTELVKEPGIIGKAKEIILELFSDNQ